MEVTRMPKTILILGGYGNTGTLLARWLLGETDACLVLSGRDLGKAERLASELKQANPAQASRLIARRADASDPVSLAAALQGVDLLLVASSTVQYTREVAAAALDARIDYLDIQYSTYKVSVLNSLRDEIETAGLCFITDGGFHPGLPAALVRYAAASFDALESAIVGSVIKIDWRSLNLPDETAMELVQELKDYQALVFRQGVWQKAGWLDTWAYRSLDFGSPFGKQYCAPMFLEEMRSLPQSFPTLVETGFYVGGFNWFVDWLVLPLAMVGLRLVGDRGLKPAARLMRWGLQTFSKPPYGTLLKLEAKGVRDSQPAAFSLTLSHDDGYQFTAIPVVATLLQYLDGSIRQAGLFTQANLVEPARLIDDMQRMGVSVRAAG
jgi:saccharopine dehydrogenase-like NADP-dependent oxidoreductase